MLSSPPSTVVF